MTILPDGRWSMSSAELDKQVWKNLKNWRVDPNDPRCLIPDFPACTRRSLVLLCTPCGKSSNRRYNCDKFNTIVFVEYCKACEARGENEQIETSSPAIPTSGDSGQVPGTVPNLLGTEPTNS